MHFVYILFTISAFCFGISIAEFQSVNAIQIISPTNDHSFELKLNELEKLLLVDGVKDRHVVVVSIAGAFRQGKSFLLNFFIKYLYAQVKKRIKRIPKIIKFKLNIQWLAFIKIYNLNQKYSINGMT